jgi:hypothetical protein
MRFDIDNDIQIAMRTAVYAGLFLARQADLRTAIYPARNSNYLTTRLRSTPRPWQVCRGRNHLAFSSTGRTGVTCTMEPSKVWPDLAHSPLPLQALQRVGEVPASAPVPLQVAQTSSRLIRFPFQRQILLLRMFRIQAIL